MGAKVLAFKVDEQPFTVSGFDSVEEFVDRYGEEDCITFINRKFKAAVASAVRAALKPEDENETLTDEEKQEAGLGAIEKFTLIARRGGKTKTFAEQVAEMSDTQKLEALAMLQSLVAQAEPIEG